MIRNMVMIELKPEADPGEVEAVKAALRALDCPGTISYTLGEDLGLREGNWSFGIVADFVDVEAYRGYDQDAAHNEARARLAPHVAQIARLQFELSQA